MSNTRLNHLLYLMPLFMTAVLLVIPFQAQAQPTSPEDTCFPVEPGAETLMCTEAQQVVVRRQTQHLKILIIRILGQF